MITIKSTTRTYQLRSSSWTVRFGTDRQIRAEDKFTAAIRNTWRRGMKRRRVKYWFHVAAHQQAIIKAEQGKRHLIIQNFPDECPVNPPSASPFAGGRDNASGGPDPIP